MNISAYILLIAFISVIYSSTAQLPYTQSINSYDSLLNVEYGIVDNYAGTPDTLLMDIYKPIGDDNCARPVMILAHGGAWVVESKDNMSMQYMARQLASRGWVVANINYRLGTNKAENYSSNFLCNSLGLEKCAYVADSAEVERANFRAMQDAKGAIRFMKGRNLIDSTDIDNVFMAGESAGGFISLSAGFTDDISKKPASCYAIGDAPTPNAQLDALDCSDPANDLSRPDLGGIEGTLNQGTYDASLRGVGSFFGGVFNTDILNGVSNPPAIYLFCQGADVVVNYDYGPLFERLTNECFSFLNCAPYEDYPNAFGGEGIRNYFETTGVDTNTFHADIVYNYNQGSDCQADGHAIDNPQQRLQSMVDFFAEKIAASGNNPQTNCSPTSNLNSLVKNNVRVVNPFDDKIKIELKAPISDSDFTLTNMSGKVVVTGRLNVGENTINTSKLAGGIYLLNIANSNLAQTLKLVKN